MLLRSVGKLLICVLAVTTVACGTPPSPTKTPAKTELPSNNNKPPLFLGVWNAPDQGSCVQFGKTFFIESKESPDEASVGAWKEAGEGLLEIKLTTDEVFTLRWEIDGNYILLTRDGSTRRLKSGRTDTRHLFRAVGRVKSGKNNWMEAHRLTAKAASRGWRIERAIYEKMDGDEAEVAGRAASVQKIADRYVIRFMDEEGDILADIACELEKEEEQDIARIKKGDHITLCGTVRVRDGRFVVAGCWVLENEGRTPPKDTKAVSNGGGGKGK